MATAEQVVKLLINVIRGKDHLPAELTLAEVKHAAYLLGNLDRPIVAECYDVAAIAAVAKVMQLTGIETVETRVQSGYSWLGVTLTGNAVQELEGHFAAVRAIEAARVATVEAAQAPVLNATPREDRHAHVEDHRVSKWG